MSLPTEHPQQVSFGEKPKEKTTKAGHAAHDAGVQTQAEHDEIAKGSALSGVESHLAHTMLPEKG